MLLLPVKVGMLDKMLSLIGLANPFINTVKVALRLAPMSDFLAKLVLRNINPLMPSLYLIWTTIHASRHYAILSLSVPMRHYAL